jgi:hypothetical protein
MASLASLGVISGNGKTIPSSLEKTIQAPTQARVITVNDNKQVESSDVNASSVGSTTDEAGLSHALLGIDGKRVNDIAATTPQLLLHLG